MVTLVLNLLVTLESFKKGKEKSSTERTTSRRSKSRYPSSIHLVRRPSRPETDTGVMMSEREVLFIHETY